MTRKEAESRIAELLKRIHEIHKQYNPNAGYLALSILHDSTGNGADSLITFNNLYWDDDEKYPIDYHETLSVEAGP